jgi:hypothetical protein
MASTQWSRKVHTKLTTLPLSVKVYNYAKYGIKCVEGFSLEMCPRKQIFVDD